MKTQFYCHKVQNGIQVVSLKPLVRATSATIKFYFYCYTFKSLKIYYMILMYFINLVKKIRNTFLLLNTKSPVLSTQFKADFFFKWLTFITINKNEKAALVYRTRTLKGENFVNSDFEFMRT